MVLFGALFAGLASAAGVSHLEGDYSDGWVKQEPVSGTQPVTFTVVVKEQGLAEVKRIALDVSDPRSPRYGQYLKQAELDKLTTPVDADMATVVSWLSARNLPFEQRGVSNLVVTTDVSTASSFFNTQFHNIRNSYSGQSVVRASTYELPTEVHSAVATIFGLHGLPIPPKKPLLAPGSPASVTPSVLESTYKIAGVKTTGNLKNRQAVAEFQGQFMNSTDLASLFSKYVTDYKKGTDDVVYKFQGEHKENSGGIEAELDIQYMMGISVGIKTEFWEFPAMDFCNDLNQWSSNITSSSDAPLVHSVSYGWQGNLTQVHCQDKDLSVVDANFAKMAAKGISIMISSGDSGSGYSAQNTQCMGTGGEGTKGVGIEGTVKEVHEVQQSQECCEIAGSAPGWTFVPHPKSLTASANFTKFAFKDAVYHTLVEGAKSSGSPFVTRDLDTLNGEVDATGGTVKVHNANSTFADSSITFSAPKQPSSSSPEFVSTITATLKGTEYKGRAIFFAFPGQQTNCVNIEWYNAKSSMISAIWEKGGNPPPPPPPGTCTIYSTVTSHTTANSTTFSGFNAGPKKVQLWPSWPASSEWVTAVGATRFVGHKIGAEEMATDQFGSGGGFSQQFQQEPNAKYQEAAVTKYLSTGTIDIASNTTTIDKADSAKIDASTLPPAGSFPPKGRATPDVSALGEGYQVIVGGRVNPVGGTSASSPAFAGMISMINEARLNAGKPPMGFLNPFLYQNEDAFTDVVLGSNKVGRGGQPLPYGFNCSAGWDPATGLGTPKFDKLLAAALK